MAKSEEYSTRIAHNIGEQLACLAQECGCDYARAEFAVEDGQPFFAVMLMQKKLPTLIISEALGVEL